MGWGAFSRQVDNLTSSVTEPLNATLYVADSLAKVLDMYGTRTTPKALANYVAEQAGLPKQYFGDETHAIRYLYIVADTLTPPEHDPRMDFAHRARTAADRAVPWQYSLAFTTLVELGWGNTRLPLEADPTVRETGEALRDLLAAKTVELAGRLLEHWQQAGHIVRL